MFFFTVIWLIVLLIYKGSIHYDIHICIFVAINIPGKIRIYPQN